MPSAPSDVRGDRRCGAGSRRVPSTDGGCRLRDRDSRWYDNEDYLMDLLAEALQQFRSSELNVQVADRGACRERDVPAESEDQG